MKSIHMKRIFTFEIHMISEMRTAYCIDAKSSSKQKLILIPHKILTWIFENLCKQKYPPFLTLMKEIFTPIDSLCQPPNAGVLELGYVLLLLFLSFPVAPV